MSIKAFRIKEVERQMQVAAFSLDFENAIVFRDQMRTLQAEAEAERVDPEARKVISIASRDVYQGDHTVHEEAPPPEEVADPVTQPSAEDVSLLKFILDEVENTRLSGLLIMAGHVEPDGSVDVVSSWSTTGAWDHMQKFIGSMEETKHDFLTVDADLSEELYDED